MKLFATDAETDEQYLERVRGSLWVNAAPHAGSGGSMRPATDEELLAQRSSVLRTDYAAMTVSELQQEIIRIQLILYRKRREPQEPPAP